ncbi:MAG TPA: CAP domain-containing protein [Dehalococcoidia bacterium]|nr:CAP domain-containing protein [Dehalococcoidia bacterium]
MSVTATFAQDEAGLAAAINAQRVTNGMAPLAVDPALTEVARERSGDQVARHYFSHTTPDGQTVFDLLNADGVSWVYGGENLAESRGMDAVQSAVSGFMHSAAHRDNVLSSHYGRIGVGAAQSADSTTVLTVVFTD